VRAVSWIPGVHARVADLDHAYTAHEDITLVVDVRAHCAAKRAAMRAHASQAGGGGGVRTLALLLRLPGPLFRLALGREFYVERARS
jgi:LmbE family N-acetylglucosaminyl deacetylase